MDNIKYIQRKFPKSNHKFFDSFADADIIKGFKKNNQKFAVLNEDVIDHDSKYPSGTYFIFNRIMNLESGSWDGTFDIVATFKCPVGHTASGYHTIKMLYEPKLTEILK